VLEFLRRLFRRRSTDSLVGLDPQRTRLIVGLGNPGPEFAETRHNLGFRCVEELARRYGAAWQDKTNAWNSLIAVIHPRADDPDLAVVLAKPQTYMNRSGAAVKALLDFLALERDKCLIVYDDMDLPFGALRLRQRGSPGTHNGMRSVAAGLESDEIPRLRIGISQASRVRQRTMSSANLPPTNARQSKITSRARPTQRWRGRSTEQRRQ